jgi:putative nucleotidyltransferase with HDIG domain
MQPRLTELPVDFLSEEQWCSWLESTLEPARYAHSLAVWQKARSLPEPPCDQFALAALLHDVGRALDPADHRPHALVGAEFCRALGLPEQLVFLVAHHSGARHEARMRGFGLAYRFFPYRRCLALAALSFLDATTGADGETVTIDERFFDIVCRYGPGSVQVHTFLDAGAEFDRGRLALEAAVLQPQSLFAAA